MGITYSTLTCDGCGEPFEKNASEIRRQKKKNPNRRFFCSRRCFFLHDGKANLGDHLGHGRTEHLKVRTADEFSPFRYYLNKARNRRDKSTDLDLEYLKALWESQNGCCILSGVLMDLPRTTGTLDRQKGNPKKASLDRIDNSKGYVRGNVRFITNIANMARQGWVDDQVLDFCRAVAQHHKMRIPMSADL